MGKEIGFTNFFEKREKEREKRRQTALKEAERLAVLLGENFSFEALYLTGSSLKEGNFHPHSDIDLVIKGLSKEFFFKALALLLGNSSFPVDLKPWEEFDPGSRTSIEEKGRRLK